MNPTDKVFILTPHAIFRGVITEVIRTTTYCADLTKYVVKYYDPVAGIAEMVCSREQLRDIFVYDLPAVWLMGIGLQAEDVCEQVIEDLKKEPTSTDDPTD